MPTVTNSTFFRQIVEDSYLAMEESSDKNRQPNPASEGGSILTLDPSHTSFKHALKVIVFAGVWLEAHLHIVAVAKLGPNAAKKFDRKKYEEKLKQLSCCDSDLLTKAERLRQTRREIVHEKAHFDGGSIKVAQAEARLAYELVRSVETTMPLG